MSETYEYKKDSGGNLRLISTLANTSLVLLSLIGGFKSTPAFSQQSNGIIEKADCEATNPVKEVTVVPGKEVKICIPPKGVVNLDTIRNRHFPTCKFAVTGSIHMNSELYLEQGKKPLPEIPSGRWVKNNGEFSHEVSIRCTQRQENERDL